MGKFHRLKNGTFGLRAWYDEDFLKRAAAAADGAPRSKKTRKTKARTKLESLRAKATKSPKTSTTDHSGKKEEDQESGGK